MSDNTYNGWRNRETWLINIWFNPESRADVELAREQFDEAYDALPPFMQDFVSHSSVDWDELLEACASDEERAADAAESEEQ